MYDKDQVRQRFLEEVERLKKEMGSYSKVAAGCGLQSYHLSDIRNSRTEVSLQVVVSFVTGYREHGVSYGYILEGKQEKAAIPRAAIRQAEKARREIEETIKVLSGK